MIRGALKEILQIPMDTPDSMLYSPRKYKGLGLFRAKWEAVLQQFNGLRCLNNNKNAYILNTCNIYEQSQECLRQLNVSPSTTFINEKDNFLDPQKLRTALRNEEYQKWCELSHKGKGVILYQEYSPANKWIWHHKGLSSSEWRDAIKMTCNSVAVRAVPGRNQDGNRCRRCHSEFETLSHVLGFCQHGEHLRNSRHHTIRHILADSLKKVGYITYEEVPGIATQGSTRRIDIIAFKPGSKQGYILDPTIRFEVSSTQPEEVNNEKNTIYQPTVPFYKEKYNLDAIEVIGLFIGARGTISKFFVNACKNFGIPSETIKLIGLSALKGSIAILRYHLYSPQVH